MKRALLIIIMAWVFTDCISQEDSFIYFDLNWEKTTQANAAFYKEVEKDGVFWYVKDFYLSGNIQMKGKYSSLDPDVQEGYFIWYYENGQKYAEGNFKHGQRDGLWTFWFPDGLKKEEIGFVRNNFMLKWRSKRIKMTRRYHERAQKMKRKGHHVEAIDILNIALQVNPYDELAFFERGEIYCLMENKEAGCKDLQQARDYMYFNTSEINEMILKYCD